jgi:hypothetical protein
MFVAVAVAEVTASSCGTGRIQVCNDPARCSDCLAGKFKEVVKPQPGSLIVYPVSQDKPKTCPA